MGLLQKAMERVLRKNTGLQIGDYCKKVEWVIQQNARKEVEKNNKYMTSKISLKAQTQRQTKTVSRDIVECFEEIT